MIRKNLNLTLKQYYSDMVIEPNFLDEVEVLEKKKIFFGLLTRTLYELPDRYKIFGELDPIYIYEYRPIWSKVKKVVICAPILGGEIEYKKGKYKGDFPIAKANAIACALFKRWTSIVVCTNNSKLFDDGKDPATFEMSIRNVAYNNIETLRWLELKYGKDITIYGLGVSLGALTMGALHGIDDSIEKSVLILGGGPLYTVISNSKEGKVVKFYERMVALYNDRTKAEKALKENIVTDPYILGKIIPDNKTLLVIAQKDNSVPTTCQRNLIKVMRPKEVISVNYPKWFKFFGRFNRDFSNGHYLTLILYPYLIYKTFKFFKD